VPFDEIAPMVDRTPEATRQLASRARRRVQGAPTPDTDLAGQRAVVDAFFAAARGGDLDGLVALLAPDAVLVGDGGGIARSLPRPMVGAAAVARALALRFLEAAREGDMDRLVAMLAPDAVLVGDGGGKARSIGVPMVGAAQVGRALATFSRMGEEWGVTLRPAVVNGGPGFRSFDREGRLVNVVGLDVQGGAIARVHSMLNPDKLGHLGPLSDIGLRPGQRPAGA
jgi:ketosteroid isomerase-like protein